MGLISLNWCNCIPFAPYFTTDLEDQTIDYDSADSDTMKRFNKYFLPEIKHEEGDSVIINVKNIDPNFM